MLGFTARGRFEPCMPAVDPIANPEAFFSQLRLRLAATGTEANLNPGERCLGVVTPNRMMMLVPAGAPGTLPVDLKDQVTRLAASDTPLKITAIGFTEQRAIDRHVHKAIPMLVPLVALAHTGNSVLVFEGSNDVLDASLSGVDMLIVDSGMLSFLTPDWATRAWRVMSPIGRILAWHRESGNFLPVVKSRRTSWEYGEPDGENSYVNCLLTTLAKLPSAAVEVVAARPLPNLAALTSDPEEREWIANLPFQYEALSAEKVIEFTMQLAKLGRANEEEGVLRAKVSVDDKPIAVSFRVRLTRDYGGREHLSITKA